MNYKRIKRINSHAGHARYLAGVSFEPHKEIARFREIPSPYMFSSTHVILRDDQNREVFIVETAHKQYDVFQLLSDEQAQ